jgi:hypothetical protein
MKASARSRFGEIRSATIGVSLDCIFWLFPSFSQLDLQLSALTIRTPYDSLGFMAGLEREEVFGFFAGLDFELPGVVA